MSYYHSLLTTYYLLLTTYYAQAVLAGHVGSVHCLLVYMETMLSAGADGTIRSWGVGGGHECRYTVTLDAGPLAQLVPMGKNVWAAAQADSESRLEYVRE